MRFSCLVGTGEVGATFTFNSSISFVLFWLDPKKYQKRSRRNDASPRVPSRLPAVSPGHRAHNAYVSPFEIFNHAFFWEIFLERIIKFIGRGDFSSCLLPLRQAGSFFSLGKQRKGQMTVGHRSPSKQVTLSCLSFFGLIQRVRDEKVKK